MLSYNSAIIFMGIGILLCSCVSQTENSAGSDWIDIQAKFSSDRFISSVIDSVSYVGLGTDEKSLIRDIDKITKSGADFIISDYRRGQIVVLDEQSGRCRFTINRIGQGPEEYL